MLLVVHPFKDATWLQLDMRVMQIRGEITKGSLASSQGSILGVSLKKPHSRLDMGYSQSVGPLLSIDCITAPLIRRGPK